VEGKSHYEINVFLKHVDHNYWHPFIKGVMSWLFIFFYIVV